MESLLKDFSSLSKYPNDSKIQLKQLTLLSNLLEILKTLDKKKLSEHQTHIENLLYELIMNSRATNDIIVRYIYYIYKHLFDFGLSSHINDFIFKYSSLLHSKTAHNIKGTSLWLICKVCTKAEYKTPQMSELIKTIMKYIKSTSDTNMKDICFGVVARLLNLKLPFFHTQIPDLLKLILKQEKYIQNKKNILKSIQAVIFYLNQQNVEKNYASLIDIIVSGFNNTNESIRKLAMNIYIELHTSKVFDNNINKQKILRKRDYEQLKNFFEVLLYVGTLFSPGRTDITDKVKSCYLQIMCQLFILNKDYLNSSESLIMKVFDLLINEFPIVIDISEGLNKVMISGNYKNDIYGIKAMKKDVNFEIQKGIEELYRTFIKCVYNVTYRKTLLLHVFKRLEESQLDMDKIENSSLGIMNKTTSNNNTNSPSKSQQGKRNKKYTEYQVNAMLLSLIEFTEHNSDIFEILYKSFQELSQNIELYVASSIRSFRLLATRVLCNLAYFLPSWRISILTLVLNMSSVAHSEVVSLRNTSLYFISESNPEYKYSVIISKNIDLLKDICNCLALILTMFSHKSHGLPVDTSLNALGRAKNIILGNSVNESDNPKNKTIKEIADNYSSVDLNAYKESGWIIIQGLCSLDRTWLYSNANTFFFLWKYIFSESSCDINEYNLNISNEYKDALITEFFIKKAALASLRKFILSCTDEFLQSKLFKNEIQHIIPNLIKFFVPYEKETIIKFYKTHLTTAYQEAKMFLYDCCYSIPIELYSSKFNSLLYSLTDEIISNEYTYTNYEHIYSCLNQTDNFMCNQSLELDHLSKQTEFIVDNFVLEKFGFKLTNMLSNSVQFVYSAIQLFVEIMSNSNLNSKNRINIFKHLLSNVTETATNKKNSNVYNNIGAYNKVVNIGIAVYLVIKVSSLKNLNFINEEVIFTNSKMIFDLCFQMQHNDNLLRLIGAEGHGYLIKASHSIKTNLNYYLTACEVKFRNESHLTQDEYINTFYLIANIFRYVPFDSLELYLDNYLNFILSNFNDSEELVHNPIVPQSIFIIIDTLLLHNKIDHVRKLIELYKMNFMFMNMHNSFFFKHLAEMNSLAEIRLMLVLAKLDTNINNNEFTLLKLMLSKFLSDEKFRTSKIQKNFLFFVKILLKCQKRLRDLVFTENFVSFLFEEKESFYEQKLSYEILIALFIDEFKYDPRKINLKHKIEMLVNYVNNLYNKNKNFYFNHKIFANNFRHINSQDLIFDTNLYYANQQATASLIDFDNFSNHNFDVLYKEFHLIKLAKFIIRIYIEKNYLNVQLLLNMIKELSQNQLKLYSIEMNRTKEQKNEALKNEESLQKNMALITIREMNYYMHLNLKKFLIKIIQNSLIESLEKILIQSNTALFEVLNYYMSNSMVLVSSEESWEIKILGIKLLSKIIKKFSTVIDNRTDDNSLIIQQYEAQISSNIKIIFNNTISIKSVYKGLKLIYMFITIPISTDDSYIKKISHMVDIINLKKNSFSILSNADVTSFSEQADHLLIMKKLVFFCKLFLSYKSNNNTTNTIVNCFDVSNVKVQQVEIYSQFINATYRKSIGEFFTENYNSFMNSVLNMLNDFYIVLTKSQKEAIEYKEYAFIFNGNTIAYNQRKIIKYGQMFIKVFGMLVNDVSIKGNEISSTKIENIFKLILFYINNFTLNNESDTNSTSITLHEENKVKYSLNIVMTIELIDSLVKIITNQYNVFTLSKTTVFNIIKTMLTLLNFGINELNIQILVMLDNIMNTCIINNKEILSTLSGEDKVYIVETFGKVMYYYYTKTSLIKMGENLIFVNITSHILNFIIEHYDSLITAGFSESSEYLCNVLKMLMYCFENYNMNYKVCASKLFNALLLIGGEHYDEVIDIIFNEVKSYLTDGRFSNTFDKYFILFYMLIQYISKKSNTNENDIEIVTTFRDMLFDNIIKPSITNKQIFQLIIKSLLLAITQNFDVHLQTIIEMFIIMVLEYQEEFIYYFTSGDELQNIILSFIINCNNDTKRKELIVIFTLILVDNKDALDLVKLCVFILKLYNKDMDMLINEEIQSYIGEDIKLQINKLILMQQQFQQEQEELKRKQEEEKKQKEENERKKKEEFQNQLRLKRQSGGVNGTASSGGPKIKALKFKK